MSKYTKQLQQETTNLQVTLASQKAKKELLSSKKKSMKAKMNNLDLSDDAYNIASRIHTKTCNQYRDVLDSISKLELAIEKRMDLLEQLEQA